MRRLTRAVVVSAVVVVAASFGPMAATAAGRPSPVPRLAKLWTARLVGPGSAPVVADGRVFVSAIKTKIPVHAKGDGSFVYAFADNCMPAPARCAKELLWKTGYPTVLDVSQRFPAVLTAPGVGDGNVYVGLNQVGADEDGGAEQALAQATGAKVFSAGQGGTSAPTVAAGFVYSDWRDTCCDGDSFTGTEALDASTGASSFTTLDSPTSPPAVAGGTLYVGSGSALNAFDATGSCPSPSPPPSPTVVAFYMDSLGFSRLCAPIWSGSAAGTITGTPAVAAGEVYVGSTNGVLYAFPEGGCGSATCAPDWTASTGAAIVSSVAVSATTVFVGSTDGTLSAYPAGGCGSPTCAPEWTASVGGSLSPPTVSGSFVLVGSTNDTLDVFADAGCGHLTCGPEWEADVGAALDTAPAVGGGAIIVTDAHHVLRAYRLP